MPWIYALASLFAGIVLGFIISRLTTPGYKKQKNLHKDLEAAKFQLEQQKQELSDHFAQSAEMLDSLGKEYTRLYQHMAKTSTELLPNMPEQDNPFAQKVASQTNVNQDAAKTGDAIDEAPKDYASGATGLLRDQKKESLNSPEEMTAKAS